jgi:hypothetical protein
LTDKIPPISHTEDATLMTEASEEPMYEFDVALSFEREDREYVEEVADRLKAAGMRVFYDADYLMAA